MQYIDYCDAEYRCNISHIWIMFVDDNDNVVIEIAESEDHEVYHSTKWGEHVYDKCDIRGYFREAKGIVNCHVSFPARYLRLLQKELEKAGLVGVYRTFSIDSDPIELEKIGYKNPDRYLAEVEV
jgi:hypothetical protein